MEAALVYITAPSREEANTIAHELVSERLAACANVVEHANAFYWWQGTVEEGKEVLVLVKTQRSLVEKITERVKKLHSYSCPCVIALPIVGGNPDYLEWIAKETTEK